MKTWKIIKSKPILKNKILRIRADECVMENGKIVKDYFVIEKPDYSIIAAFTKEKQLIMIRQYRHPIGKIDIELPAGFTNKGESHMTGAKRELLEETGYRIAKLKKLGKFYASPGVLNNNAHIFIGYDASKIANQKLDKNEQIEPLLMTKKDVIKLIKQGKIKDVGTALVLNIIFNNNLWII